MDKKEEIATGWDELDHYQREMQKQKEIEERKKYEKRLALKDYEELSLKEKYLSLANQVSFNNLLLNEDLFHVLIGQLVRNVKIRKGVVEIDPRINIALLQPTRTGKGRAADFFLWFCRELGLKIKRPTEWSDAGLLGHIENFVESEYDKKVKKWVQKRKRKVVYGAFKDCDIFYQPEGSSLFSTTRAKWKENTLNYINIALDPIGSNLLQKKLSHEEVIEFYPAFSAVVFSQYYHAVSEEIMRSGFLQRFLFVPRNVTVQERRENAKKDAELAVASKNSDLELFEEKKKILLKELSDFRDKYQTTKVAYFPEKMEKVLASYNENLFSYIEPCSSLIRELVAEYISGYFDLYLKLGVQFAYLGGRKTPKEEDMRKAEILIKKNLNYIILWFETELPNIEKTIAMRKAINQHKIEKIRKMFKALEKEKGEYVSTGTLVRKISKTLHVSESTVNSYWIPLLRSHGLLEEKKEKTTVWKKVL